MSGSALTISGTAQTVAAGFDYSTLDKAAATKVRAAAEQIRTQHKRIGSMIISIGVNLVGVKELVGHGNFEHWLDAEFGMSERTARRYMQAAVLKDKTATVSVLPATTIYAITAASVPEPVRAEILTRLDAGEHLDDTAIRDVIAEGRRTAQQERDEAKLSPEQRRRRKAAKARQQTDREKFWEQQAADDALRQQSLDVAAASIASRFGKDIEKLIDVLDASQRCHELVTALRASI